MFSNTKLSSALAALVITAAIAAPAADARGVANKPVLVAPCDPSAVPPPPSSIAASAAKEYSRLRACAQDDTATVATAPDAFEPSPPTGFDWVSATIGAIAAAGLSLLLAAALGVRPVTSGGRGLSGEQ
jgi:hypothetical protein